MFLLIQQIEPGFENVLEYMGCTVHKHAGVFQNKLVIPQKSAKMLT